MVEFKILNGNFEELGTIDDFIALIWDRKYYDVGSFELHVETKYFELLIGAAYLWSESFVDTAVIQSIVLDREKQELTVTGNFLDEILRDRIITDIINANKTPEEFMRDWVNRYCIADSARRINKLKLQNATGIGYKVPVQTRGDELPSKIREIATPQECGFRLVYDYFKDEMWPEIYQGKDRTKEQTKNSLAIFSDDEDTAELKNYTRDTKDYKNFAYVAGEGDDNARIIVTVDQTAGEARRELWVDARDVQREEGESDSSYRQKLIQRGKDKLTESRISESTEFSPEETTSLIYGFDYDLGDLCTAADKKTGIKYDARVEEIVISIEKGTVTYTPTLGKPTVSLLGKPKNQTKINYSDIIGKPQSFSSGQVENVFNSGYHNSIYRGKDISANEADGSMYTNIASGTFGDVFVGDYFNKTVNGRNYVFQVLGCDVKMNRGDTALIKHHIVVMPTTSFGSYKMNDTNTTDGGYVGSKMYTDVLPVWAGYLSNAFGSHLITSRELLANATSLGVPSGWSWFNSTVNLMTVEEVLGHGTFGLTKYGYYFNIGISYGQLPLFRLSPDKICRRYTYWLRNIPQSTLFSMVSSEGYVHVMPASYSLELQPYFLLE